MCHRLAVILSCTIVIVVAASSLAGAQTCQGSVSVTNRATVFGGVGVSLSSSLSGRAVAHVGGGNDRFFATADIASNSNDLLFVSLDSTEVGVTAGAQWQPPKEPRVAVCPLFTFSREFGFSIHDYSFDMPMTHVGGGISVGIVAGQIWKVRFVPTASFSIVYTSISLPSSIEFNGWTLDLTDFESVIPKTTYQVALGAGIVISDRFSLVPMVAVPLQDVAFGTAVSLSANVSLFRLKQ
jgi:hypothetical protein